MSIIPFLSMHYTIIPLRTPWRRVLPEKLVVLQLVKKFPEFYGSRKFITVFTRFYHLSLFWASLFESMLPTDFPKIRFNSILPSIPVSCKWFLSLSFSHQKRLYTSPLFHTCYMSRLSHSPWFYHVHATSFISLHVYYILLTIWSPPDSAFSLYF